MEYIQAVLFTFKSILVSESCMSTVFELTKEFIHIRLQYTTVKKEHNNWLKTYNLI